MHGKNIVIIVILLVISFSMMPTIVRAGESHENFDYADTDISALLYMLNQTQLFMRLSLEHSLSVGYMQEIDSEPLTYDYSEKDLSEAIMYADNSTKSVGIASSILDDIEDVSSAEYLEQLYLPHYWISQDLIMYSGTHRGLLLNLSSTITIYNLVHSEERENTYLYEGVGALQNASLNLHRMDTYLDRVDDGVETLDDSLFNISALETVIEDNYVLLEYYREVIDELLLLFHDVPSYLSFFAPLWAYPGEVITVNGHYMEEGRYVSGKTIEVRMDETYLFQAETDQGGYYEIHIPVPWNATDSIRLNASTPENIVYREAVVEIHRYPTSIVLEITGYYFYDEDIELKGRFETDAPVDLSTVELRATGNITLMPNDLGNFDLTYHSGDFGWGSHTINVSYAGNISMLPSEEYIELEVSIPTHITLDCDLIGYFENRSLPITFFGTLINESSTESIPNQYVFIQDYPDMGSFTDINGSYAVTTTVNKMGLFSWGLYMITARFNGTQKYREAVSEPLRIYIYLVDNGSYVIGYSLDDLAPWMDDDEAPNGKEDVKGQDDEEVLGLSRDYFFFFMGILIIIILLIILYKNKIEDSKKRGLRSKAKPVKMKKVLRHRKLPSANSRDDIPLLYGHALEVLDSKGIVSITKGKTPRDIVGEITQSTTLKQYLDELTSVFEKAFFSAQEVTTSEIKSFNRALKMIVKEVKVW